MILIYKNKGDIQSCASNCDIKHSIHRMKRHEKVIDHTLKDTRVKENQFQILVGRIEALFFDKEIDGSSSQKKERSADDVHWLIKRILKNEEMSFGGCYRKTFTSVRTIIIEDTIKFPISLGIHHESVLGMYLFPLVMNHLTQFKMKSIVNFICWSFGSKQGYFNNFNPPKMVTPPHLWDW